MKIAITSGKGGTGKTTVSTGLFHVLTKYKKHQIQLLDCDVEEPDCHIFIKASRRDTYPVHLSLPVIDPEKCTFCGKCKISCAYNAVVILPTAGFIEVDESLCHGCGACIYVCPEDAITEKCVKIGRVAHFNYLGVNKFIEGRMNIGRALQTPVIRETIKHAEESEIILFDAPPGTSCPVVATISSADYVLIVTEPSPFGLHDLKLMVETVRQIGRRHGVIVNKAGLDYGPLYEYIHQNAIPLIGEIPFRRELAGAYSRGEIIADSSKELRSIFTDIIDQVLNGEAL